MPATTGLILFLILISFVIGGFILKRTRRKDKEKEQGKDQEKDQELRNYTKALLDLMHTPEKVAKIYEGEVEQDDEEN